LSGKDRRDWRPKWKIIGVIYREFGEDGVDVGGKEVEKNKGM
jgi:hypothetical protein